ncbi:hypothetical protein BB560_004182, partial [Smittium megazygosporum]
ALSTNYFPELSNVSDKLADQNQVYEAQQVGFGSELTNTQTPSPNQVYSFNEIINNRYYSTDQQFWIDQGQPFGFDNGLGLNVQIKDNSLNSFDIGGCIGTNFDALFNEASSAKSSNKVSSSNISPEVPEAPYLAYQVTNIDKSLYLNDVNIYKTILTVFALGDYTESIGNGFSKVGQHNGEYLRHTNTAHFTSLKTRGRNTGSSPCIKKRSKNHKKNTRPKMAGRPLETNGALPIPRPQGIKKRFWAEEGIDTLGISFDNVTITRRMDNNMVNGTKLLNLAGLSRGKRDGILKKEPEKLIVKSGKMSFKGVWIPLERARMLATRFEIYSKIDKILDDNLNPNWASCVPTAMF